MDKNTKLKELYQNYDEKFSPNEFVFGFGNIDASIIIIGEAPGKNEVEQAKPFVGQAGKNLSRYLKYSGLKREDIYISNLIKYRLSKKSPKSGNLINRPAKVDELKSSRPYLIDEIRIIDPKIIVTLGNVPLKALYGDMSINIGKVVGQLLNFEKYILLPFYHPASVIYNNTLEDVLIKDFRRLGALIQQVESAF